ncbi:IS3 family transposase [Streptomyces sp. NBC_01637]|uniref:IS3 family transposase n=1 Tax=unclassified Streptomyces TaxID=2593676 RepID=UPI00386C62FA|nr:IS3 family transposase [Streptomyces sp. NBC_01653]WTD87530.1 IS3 family transposase [Streptomyces sp. NBC_01637]
MTEKYEFIDDEADNSPVQRMCTWSGVSTSGFYHWRSRPLSATAKRRAELRAVILQIFSDSQETYGYRRIHAVLQGMDVQAGAELVRALMRELGLVPSSRGRRSATGRIITHEPLSLTDLTSGQDRSVTWRL